MKTFLVKLITFGLILWITSFVLARALDRSVVKDRTQKQMWTLSQQGRSFGYVVAGDSRTFNTIDPKTLEAHTGQSTINIGFGGQGIIESYLTVYLFLQNRNQTRNVVLQIDGSDLDGSLKFQTHLYVPHLADPEVANVVRDVIGSKKYSVLRIFPLA